MTKRILHITKKKNQLFRFAQQAQRGQRTCGRGSHRAVEQKPDKVAHVVNTHARAREGAVMAANAHAEATVTAMMAALWALQVAEVADLKKFEKDLNKKGGEKNVKKK